jgi:putative ABC transport system permease protein
MNLGSIAIWNLGRRPMRSLLTALGIAAAVGSLVAMVGLSRGMDRAWFNHFQARGSNLIATQKGAVEILTTSIDEKVGEKIRRIEGVQDIGGELADIMALETEITTLAVGWLPGSYLWGTAQLIKGRLPSTVEGDAVLLGQSAAEALHKKPGDPLLVRDRTLKIVGIFRMSGVIGNNSVILPLAIMQEIVQRPGKVTVFHLRIKNPEDPTGFSAVKTRLQAQFPNLSFMETTAAVDSDLVLQLFRAVSWSISVMAIVIALVVMVNTLLMRVLEQTHEIGVLSAVGWSTGRIVAMIMLEGLILAFLGGITGLALGVGGLHWLTNFPQVKGLIQVEVTTRLLLEVMSAVVVLGCLGSLYPAWRAARLNIVDALRYE